MKDLKAFTLIARQRRFDRLNNASRPAFTLIEILIALTIIGIIAVLTIPSLIADTSTKAYQTKFKTTFVQIQQGLINNANIKKRPFIKVDNTSGGSYHLEDYMKAHFRANKVSRTITPADSDSKTFKLKNGSHLIFPKATLNKMNATGCASNLPDPCMFYIDINGSKEPNETVECTTGTTSSDLTASCSVSDEIISDVFAIIIKNDHIYPATNAVNFVMNK